MHRMLTVLACAWILTMALGAQRVPSVSELPSSPQFETASIRPAAESPRGAPQSPDRFIAQNATLAELIESAYDVQRSQVVGGEAWTRSMRFDVEAKASQIPTPDVKRAMVRFLLAQRFGLRVGRETRDISVFVLTKRGERLGSNFMPAVNACVSEAETQAEPPLECRTILQAKPGASGLTLMYKTPNISVPEFAKWLAPYAGRFVVDRTGLSGRFSITLSFAPGNTPSTDAISDAPPSVFTAVREQLGLALQAGEAPVEVVIIQSAHVPTDN